MKPQACSVRGYELPCDSYLRVCVSVRVSQSVSQYVYVCRTPAVERVDREAHGGGDPALRLDGAGEVHVERTLLGAAFLRHRQTRGQEARRWREVRMSS